MGILGDAFGGLMGYLGAQSTNQTNYDIAQQSNAASAQQAQLNRDFQAQQSSTSYQRAVKDMEAAGLNPMLAYSQGGASTSAGATAQVNTPTMQNPMSSAMEGYHQSRQRDLISAQVANVNADTRVKDEDAIVKQKQADLLASQKLAADAQERNYTTSANKATHDLFTQQNVTNPTQKALAASYWSQVSVNNANLPKIASEIASNGAYAAQARAQAFKAIQEGKITKEDYQAAVNRAAFEKSAVGKSSRFIDYGLNSAGKVKDLLPSKSTTSTTEEHTDIIRDDKGNQVGSSRYRTTR